MVTGLLNYKVTVLLNNKAFWYFKKLYENYQNDGNKLPKKNRR